jgi:hypothetical protein
MALGSIPPESLSLTRDVREAAPDVPEELAFEQRVGEGGAVHRDERRAAALAAPVDLAREDLARDQEEIPKTVELILESYTPKSTAPATAGRERGGRRPRRDTASALGHRD